MNAGSGRNLNWFWKKWFFETGTADLAISSVTHKLNAYKVVITSVGSKPVPIDLTITYADKSTSRIHQSVAAWEKGNPVHTLTIPTNKRIEKVELGSTWVPDVNKKDNVFFVK